MLAAVIYCYCRRKTNTFIYTIKSPYVTDFCLHQYSCPFFFFHIHGSVHRCNNLNKNANQMYFVLKSLKFVYIIPLYIFRTPLCPSSGASQLHMQSLVPCGAWFIVSSSPAMSYHCQLQHSRTGGHNEPSTTRDQRLHVQLRSS